MNLITWWRRRKFTAQAPRPLPASQSPEKVPDYSEPYDSFNASRPPTAKQAAEIYWANLARQEREKQMKHERLARDRRRELLESAKVVNRYYRSEPVDRRAPDPLYVAPMFWPSPSPAPEPLERDE